MGLEKEMVLKELRNMKDEIKNSKDTLDFKKDLNSKGNHHFTKQLLATPLHSKKIKTITDWRNWKTLN